MKYSTIEDYDARQIALRREIVAYVDTLNTWFELDSDVDEVDEDLVFSSREYGDVGDGSSGLGDEMEGVRLHKLLKSKFKNISVYYEEVDEWVILTINTYGE